MKPCSKNGSHGLTPEQVQIIEQILTPYRGQITQVSLFGSRATGAYRPYSDIDLVLYGPIPAKTVDHLWTLFSESSLPYKVDLQAYDLIENPELKAHIDRVALPLLAS
jgi:predicted nucleotidyltransferase